MKSNKINVTIRIDKDIWELAKIMLPCSRNAFIEKQLKNYVDSIDEIKQLEQEIEEANQSLAIKQEKLNYLKEIRERNNRNKETINKAMETVFNIVQEHGEISESQITYIANHNNINRSVLVGEINKFKFKISKYTKEEKETTIKNVKI